MIWPFDQFTSPRSPSRGTIEAIYGMIVAQAREPAFYKTLGVQDSVNGRFEMIVLHLWLVLRQARAQSDNVAFGQALFDYFCSDLDANLREMGVGDLTVPKRMQKFGEAFYGRAAAYDNALADEDNPSEAMAKALCRNVLNGFGLDKARLLAAYVDNAAATLARVDAAALRSGRWRFPPALAVA
ncbi:ubiquinol-cytochrome C chaperone family protein [Rhodopseudomonas palustris]|uniref:Ubiquinol-cytochrome C chaperone n=1 Tax=Rhodopseudomonas palustris (strain BisB18) TaxID=316056 RepID=Q214G4_RHOPB